MKHIDNTSPPSIIDCILLSVFLVAMCFERNKGEIDENGKFIPNNSKSKIGWQAVGIGKISDERLIFEDKEGEKEPSLILKGLFFLVDSMLDCCKSGLYFESTGESKICSSYQEAEKEGEKMFGAGNFEVKSVNNS